MAVSLRQALVGQLVESLGRPLPSFTPRRVFGRTGLPGKATAVTGMRRAGKTTFLHQLRRERIERASPWIGCRFCPSKTSAWPVWKLRSLACWWTNTTGASGRLTTKR